MARFLAVGAVILQMLSKAAGDCMEPAEGDEKFVMQLPYKKHPDNVTVTGIPTDAKAYAYATDHALVAIPEACYKKHEDKITASKELNDRQPGGPTGMRYLYISDLEGGYDTLAEMTDCACGLVIEMHGSGGPGWTAVMFGAWFSGMGLIEVMPNSMAMPDDLGLKGKLPMKKIEDINTDNYCGGFSAFDGSCGSFNKPYCYSTKDVNILANGDKYRKYVEGVYQIRRRELQYFVDNQADLLNAFTGKVYLVGNSEGSMVASRFHDPALDKVMAGRILTAYACDFNYFVSCEESSQVCEDSCDKSIPQLNVIGTEDEYFGNQDGSMSYKIANGEGGYGGPLTGNCRAKYDAQKFKRAVVVEFEGAGHGPSYWNDNTMRGIFADFMKRAGKRTRRGKGRSLNGKKSKRGRGRGGKRFDRKWKSLKGCKKVDGVFSCPIGDASPCMPGWKLNADASWEPASEYTCEAAGDDKVKLFQASEEIGSWQTSPPIFVASIAVMVALLVASAVGLRRRKVQKVEQDEELLMVNE